MFLLVSALPENPVKESYQSEAFPHFLFNHHKDFDASYQKAKIQTSPTNQPYDYTEMIMRLITMKSNVERASGFVHEKQRAQPLVC